MDGAVVVTTAPSAATIGGPTQPMEQLMSKSDEILTRGLARANEAILVHLLHALQRNGILGKDQIDIIFGSARETAESNVARFLVEHWENKFFLTGQHENIVLREAQFKKQLGIALEKDLDAIG